MNLYPIITTLDPAQCRDFYVKAFDARVLFQADWFVHLAIERWEMGFLKPNPPVPLPLFRNARLSSGLCFALEVDDAEACYERLRSRGVEALGRPQRSSTGEVAFSLLDPAGVVLNVVEVKPDTSQIIEL